MNLNPIVRAAQSARSKARARHRQVTDDQTKDRAMVALDAKLFAFKDELTSNFR
jgi:hypothetical protein